MAESYRGLTIRIGGDTSKLTKALRSTNGAITQTQQELRKVGQALKLDPGNIQAFSQQMGYMANQATNTAAKLAMLKRTQDQMRDMNISLSTGETGTVENFARATAEFGGEVENIAGRLATAQTRFNQLTSTLATMHNEVTDLAKDMVKVRQQRIVDAFDLASGKKSIDDIREAFSTLPDGTQRAKEAVDEYVASVEKISEVSKRVATSSGTEQNKAATELRKLLKNDHENPDGTSLSSSAIKDLIDTMKAYGEKYQEVVADVAKGNGEMESSQRETEDKLLADHRKYFQERTAIYEAAKDANRQAVEEEKAEREELYKAANEQLTKLREAEDQRKKKSDDQIKGYDDQIAAIDRQLDGLGKVVVTEDSLREKIEQVTAAREEQKAWYTEAKANIERQIREWEELRKERERALQENDDPAVDKSVIKDLQNAVSECDEEIEKLNADRQKLISENRSDVAKLAGDARRLSNDLAKIQNVGQDEFNEKHRRKSEEEVALGKEKVAVEKQRTAAIAESTKAEERFNEEYEAARSFKTPELEDFGKRVDQRKSDFSQVTESYYADIADSMTRTDKEIQKSSDQTSGALEKNSAQVQKSLDSMFREMSKYGKGMDGFSSLVFNNKNGNTDIETMGPMIDEMTKKLGLSEYAAQNFKAAIADISDEFKGANKDVQQLEQIAKYQDLVAEIMKSEAAVKQLSRAMSDMHMPSDLMRGMYTLNANVKELEASYKALSATGSGLSSIFKSDPTNMEAASQAMNAFNAAEMVATETAERMRQRLEKFDTGAIDRATDSTKSATQQLFDASLAAEQAKESYAELSGQVQFLEAVNKRLEGVQPATLNLDDEEAAAVEKRYEEACEDLEKFNAELAEAKRNMREADTASRDATKALDGAKMRKEYEELSSGATVYANNARKAAEAAREIFVQRSVAETFGDTSALDRLKERIGTLTSSASAFENAFEFDPRNVDMASASMTRLQEAEALAAQRIADLSTKVSAMDTSKVDELREKYGSVTAAVDKTREAVEDVPDIASKLMAVQTLDNVPSYLDGIREKLLDPTATFKDYEIEFLPKSIADAHRSLSDLREVGVDTLRDLADAEKALKFEQMQEEIAAARMELEKLMRQEHEIVVRLSLQGEFGDTTKITDALDGAMQAAMGRVGTFDNALKFDTKNVDLLDARMRAVTDAMNLGAREADALKAAIAKIDASDVEEMRTAYGSTSNAVRSTTEAVETLISKVAEAQAEMDSEEEGTKAYDEAREKVERLREALDNATQSSAKAAKYEQWERYSEQLAKVSAAMHGLNEDVREVAERNVEAFSANYSEGMFGDVDEQVASFDAAIQKAEERYRKYTDALAKEPHSKLFKDEQAKALAEAVDLTNQKVAYLKQTMSQFDQSKIAALKEQYGSFGRAVDDGKLKLKATEAEIETLRQKVAEFAANNGKDAAWVRQFTDAKAEIKSIPPELAPVRARIVELFDVQGGQQLELAIASVCSRLEEMGDEANVAQAALRKALEGDGSSFMDSAAFTQAAQEMGQWARQAGQHIVDSANTIDSAYRDMRKTVEGTEEDFERIRQAAIEFSQTHAISADQMLEMEALGGQLGVLSHNLEQFGRLGSNISIATDIEANDAALQLGQMQNIMSDLKNMDDLEHFGDALVRLGNNAAAQESAIMNVAQRIAAVGNVTSMSAPEVLGWSAAIAETGQRSESAATALQRTITGIGDAVNKGGSTLQNFAAIANMSTDEFKAAWENSSSDALKAFIVGLEGLTDSSTAAIQALDDVNISSVRQETALLALSQTVDNLDDNITMSKDAFNGMSDAWGDAGDAAREAQNKSEGFSGSLAIMQNNANNLAASLGDGLKPFLDLISGAMRTLTDLLNGMSPGMKSAVVTVGGLAMVLGTTVPIINQFRKGWTEMAQAIRNHVTISKATSKSMSEDSANTTANTETKVANTGATEANSVASETAGKAKQTEAAAAGENSTAMASDTASTEANTLATAENAAASEAAAAAKKREKSAALDSVDAMADAADSIDDVTDAVDNATDAADSMGDIAREAKEAGKAADGIADTVDTVADVTDAATDAADAMGDVAKGAAKAGDAVTDVAKGADAVADVVDAATDVAGAMAGATAASGAAAGAIGEVATAGGAAAGAAGGLSASLAGLAATAGPMMVVAGAVVVLTDMLNKAAGVAGDYMLAMEAASDVSSIKDAFPDAQSLEATKTSLSELRSGFEGALNTIKSFGDAAQQTIDETEAGTSVVEQYGKKIEELSSQSKLTDAEQRLLEQTVTAFNDKTGAGIEIVDAATGKLNVMTGQVKELTEAYRVQAEQQAYTALYEEALKKQAEAQIEYDRAMGQFNATFGETVELMDILGDGPAMAFQKLADAFGMEAAANGAKKALDETGYSIDWLSDKISSASFSFGSLESAMASAGLTTEQYSSLTDEQKSKLAEIQAALINAGHSLAEYKNLTADQLAQIIAAWTGSVPEIIKSIEGIQKSAKAATNTEPPTVDYTEVKKERKKELDQRYNDQKKEYDAEYKQQQKTLDKQYKAAQKASQKYLKDFKKAQSEEVDAFKAATDAKVKEIEREYEAKQKLLDQEYERYDSQYDDRIAAIEAEQDAEDEAKKQRERKEKLDELNQKVATARSNKARKEAEKELNDYLDDLRAEDTKAQRDAQIQKLKDQKSALKEQYDDRKKELKDSYDLAVSNYKAQREAELKLLQEKQEAEYEMVSESEQANLERIKESHQDQLEDLKNFHDSKLQELKDANEAELEAIGNGNAAKEQAAAEHAENMKAIANETAAANESAKNSMQDLYKTLAQNGQLSASEYVRAMQGVPGALASVFENLGLATDEGTKMVARLMLRNGEITIAEYNNIMSGMPGATKAIANDTGIALASQLGLFGEDARVASQGLVDNVKYPMDGMAAYAKARASETASAVAGMGSEENASKAATGAGNLVNAVNAQFTGITKPAELASVQIPGALANVGSQENSDAVAKSTGNLVNAVNSQFTGITKPAEAASVQIPSALASMGSQENVDAVANSTGNLVKGVNAQFKDMDKYANAAGANVPPALASGIGKNADDAARISASMVKGVAETTNSIEKPMSTYGANASIGWLNEFSKYAQEALNYVGQWANNILAKVTVPHMINSPSRKFAWMARMDLEGFRKGWEQNEDGTLRMVGGTADALSGAFSPSLDANADFMQSLIDDMRSKEGELLRQAQRMAEIVERGFDPELTVDAAYEAIDRIDRGRLRRQQMVASSQSVDNSTYAPVLNFTINATVREEADIDMISNQIAVKVQRQLNSRIG